MQFPWKWIVGITFGAFLVKLQQMTATLPVDREKKVSDVGWEVYVLTEEDELLNGH